MQKLYIERAKAVIKKIKRIKGRKDERVIVDSAIEIRKQRGKECDHLVETIFILQLLIILIVSFMIEYLIIVYILFHFDKLRIEI